MRHTRIIYLAILSLFCTFTFGAAHINTTYNTYSWDFTQIAVADFGSPVEDAYWEANSNCYQCKQTHATGSELMNGASAIFAPTEGLLFTNKDNGALRLYTNGNGIYLSHQTLGTETSLIIPAAYVQTGCNISVVWRSNSSGAKMSVENATVNTESATSSDVTYNGVVTDGSQNVVISAESNLIYVKSITIINPNVLPLVTFNTSAAKTEAEDYVRLTQNGYTIQTSTTKDSGGKINNGYKTAGDVFIHPAEGENISAVRYAGGTHTLVVPDDVIVEMIRVRGNRNTSEAVNKSKLTIGSDAVDYPGKSGAYVEHEYVIASPSAGQDINMVLSLQSNFIIEVYGREVDSCSNCFTITIR